MLGQIKSLTVDRFLLPIRQQVISRVEAGSSILEFGCGTGDLLLKLDHKIKYGLGIDASSTLVKYAHKKSGKEGAKHIEFRNQFLNRSIEFSQKFDIGLASLFFHIPPWSESKELLLLLRRASQQQLIIAFTPPKTRSQQAGMWLDQRFTSHYKHYKEYAKRGYMNGLILETNLKINEVIDTFEPTMKIYVL